MKKFEILASLLLLLGLFLSGCQKEKSVDPTKMHWDRDVCERCKMAISEKKFAFQIVNPTTSKVYKFDDIGCGVLWMDEEKIPWKDKAILWVTDAHNGKWIDARTALYTDDRITPMAYGIAAYTKETLPKGATVITFEQARDVIYEIEKLNVQKLREMRTQ